MNFGCHFVLNGDFVQYFNAISISFWTISKYLRCWIVTHSKLILLGRKFDSILAQTTFEWKRTKN